MGVNKDIKKMIEENPLALATADKNWNPRVIVVADVKLINDKLLIGDNYMRKTKENVMQNKKVCLVVWDNSKGSEAEGYQIEGIAEYYNHGKFLEIVKKIHGNAAKGAVVVKIDKIIKLLG